MNDGESRARNGTLVPILLIVILAVLIASALMPVIGRSVSRPSWEYTVVFLEDLEFESGLTALGNGGWNLTFARRATSGEPGVADDKSWGYECILKRPK